MKNQTVKITAIKHETHDVLNIHTEKPENVKFAPGQATEVVINKEGWKEEGRPFTFVCLPKDDYLEFMIKTYPDHDGVTNQLLHLEPGDELILTDIFGAIHYKDEGAFIAGGAGVTPFISILRDLRDQDKIGDNKLIFANKSDKDIILQNEFREMLGDNFTNILEEETEGYAKGRIDQEFLRSCNVDPDKYIYLCGPIPMMDAVKEHLADLGVDENKIVQEEF